MVAEMVPERELQPKAFSLMPLVWSIGSVFGPAFGGFFARPADQFPDLFGHIEYFKRFPFALPNLMACCVFFISFMTGLLFLKVSHLREPPGPRTMLTRHTGNARGQTPQAGLGLGIGREADSHLPSAQGAYEIQETALC